MLNGDGLFRGQARRPVECSGRGCGADRTARRTGERDRLPTQQLLRCLGSAVLTGFCVASPGVPAVD
jgi:hypothetical protein